MYSRKLFLIVLLQCSFIVNAQYIPLPLDTNHYWQQNSTFKTTAGDMTNCHYFLKVEKDSLINGKVFKYVTTKGGACDPFYFPGYFQKALIRQDSVKRIVTLFVQGTEKIIYNFNKNIGDTAILYNYDAGVTITHTLISKNSFIANDGLNHPRFGYNDLPEMIEGVGSKGGLLTPWLTFERFHSIQCLWNNTTSSTVYNIQGSTVSCPLPLGLRDKELYDAGLTVYPNPTKGALRITSEHNSISSYEIITLHGKTVINVNDVNAASSTVMVTSLRPGIYFVKIRTGGYSVTRRFVVD